VVATLVKLKTRLTINGAKRSTARLIVWILALVYVLALCVMLDMSALVVGMGQAVGYESLTGSACVLIGSAIVLCWAILPSLFFGADQTLDPRRFELFPLSGRDLAPGLVLASFIGTPGLATVLIGVAGLAFLFISQPLLFVIQLAAGVLGCICAMLACRVVITAMSGLLSSRRGKELSAVISTSLVLVLGVGGGLGLNEIMTQVGDNAAKAGPFVEGISGVLAWTPLGAPWALGWDAAAGNWPLLAAHLLLSLAYIAVLGALYAKLLDRALVTPVLADSGEVVKSDAIARAESHHGQGAWTPVWAVAARCRRYWIKDPRYSPMLLMPVLLPVLFVVLSKFSFSAEPVSAEDVFFEFTIGPSWPIIGYGLAALMMGYAISADIAMDSTAWWQHLASGQRGWVDPAGRIWAEFPFGMIYYTALGVALPLILGTPGQIGQYLAVGWVCYLVPLGVSSVSMGLVIYPIALPGESATTMKTQQMGTQMLAQLGNMLVVMIAASPVLIAAVFVPAQWMWPLAVIALVWGAGMMCLGVAVGGKIIDARGPEILSILKKNDSRE
jgi:ABC-2 type transport system permease protein